MNESTNAEPAAAIVTPSPQAAAAALTVAAAVALPMLHAAAATANMICPEWECGSNHNERVARDGIRLPPGRAIEALTAATALILSLASPMVTPNSAEGMVVAARVVDEEPTDSPPAQEPCDVFVCGGNHNESVVRDRC